MLGNSNDLQRTPRHATVDMIGAVRWVEMGLCGVAGDWLGAQSSLHTTAECAALRTTHRRRTHGYRATLTEELSGCPASTECCQRVGCWTTAGTCRTHEQPWRHTMAPDAADHPLHYPIATKQHNQVSNANCSHENKRRVNE
jgi:hypothetical protein